MTAFPVAVCAFSPCRRKFETAAGRSGVFCSDRCFHDELEVFDGSAFAPNLSLSEARADDDAHAQADGAA
jgi:hypothetical protein